MSMTSDVSLQTGWSTTVREKNRRKENRSEDCLQTETKNTELNSKNNAYVFKFGRTEKYDMIKGLKLSNSRYEFTGRDNDTIGVAHVKNNVGDTRHMTTRPIGISKLMDLKVSNRFEIFIEYELQELADSQPRELPSMTILATGKIGARQNIVAIINNHGTKKTSLVMK